MSDPLSLQGERVSERVLRRCAGAFGEGYARVSRWEKTGMKSEQVGLQKTGLFRAALATDEVWDFCFRVQGLALDGAAQLDVAQTGRTHASRS